MRRIRTCLLAALLLASAPSAARAQTVFSEDFSDNSAGWTMGSEWQIGPTLAGPAPAQGFPDPANDRTATPDNGVAGTVIGGDYSVAVHPFYWLESPVIDISTLPGTALLTFWRWLNIDYPPFAEARVEVFNGSAWVTIYQNGGTSPVTDGAWAFHQYDVTPFKNANFRVRFGHAIGQGGAFVMSGWNIDDVEVGTPCTGVDADGDTYVSVACGGDDCDDSNPAIHPGATEVCDAVDNDCDGDIDEGLLSTFYPDADEDTYGWVFGAVQACTAPPGYIATGGDCNDGDPAIHPGATEVCDSVDNNCDGQVDEGVAVTYYPDVDGDTFGNPGVPTPACSPPAFHVTNPDDCDDGNPDIHPGATEVCNGADDDCDGTIDEDCAYLTIESILDVAADNGRNVRITWVRDGSDSTAGPLPTTSYSIWRRIAPGLAAAGTARPAGAGLDAGAAPAADALPPGQWDFITWVPAVQEQRYHYVAPTLCDSSAAGVCWSVFLVRAHRASGAWQDAPVDSGYSVDNLVPPPPAGAVVQFTGAGAELSWQPCPATDFRFFHIYRGSDPAFVPSPANRVHTTSGTSWSDPAGVAGHVYKLTAVDFNGNESAPTTALGPTGVGTGVPARTGIALVAPNPARASAAITFDLSAAAEVRLEVLDLSGRLVRRLAHGRWAAGRHPLAWDGRTERGEPVAAGIYLVRLAAGGRLDVRRLAITR